jgi:hypothetical protein
MNAPDQFEQLVEFLDATLPSPIERHAGDDGSLLFTRGSPGEVVVRLTHTSVIVSEYAGEWDTPYAFTVRPRRVGMLKWRRLSAPSLLNALSQLIAGAREARRGRYRRCCHCGASSPPEWMHTDEVCVGCAHQQMGVIH